MNTGKRTLQEAVEYFIVVSRGNCVRVCIQKGGHFREVEGGKSHEIATCLVRANFRQEQLHRTNLKVFRVEL